MKKDNKGMTLIELIVVIAVIAIITAALGLSFALVGRQRVSNGALSVKETIQLAQSYAKSKGACMMRIKANNQDGIDSYIYTADKEADLSDLSKCKLGNGPNAINKNIKVTVKFQTKSAVEIKNGRKIDIIFDRTTGGFKNAKVDGAIYDVPVEIVFSNGQKTMTLCLATYTGVVTYK